MAEDGLDFADTSSLEEMFGETGVVMERGVEGIQSAKALGASDGMLWALIIGSTLVMTMGALRQVAFKGMVIWEKSREAKLQERHREQELQAELFMRKNKLGQYMNLSEVGDDRHAN